jgi:hypothetical protein
VTGNWILAKGIVMSGTGSEVSSMLSNILSFLSYWMDEDNPAKDLEVFKYGRLLTGVPRCLMTGLALDYDMKSR